MSLKDIRKVLNESLFGDNNEPKVGFMEYDYSDVNMEEFDDLFQTIKDQLNQVSVDSKTMKTVPDQKKIIIVTTQDKASDVEDIFSYFKMPCVKSIFDPQTPDEKAQNHYPEPSEVQNTGHRLY